MGNKNYSNSVSAEKSYKVTYEHEQTYASSDITDLAPSYTSHSQSRHGKDPIRPDEQEQQHKYQKRQNNKNNNSKKTEPYQFLRRHYTRFSTSFMLENKAATARDHLANERTFLAWIRTSLTLITVGLAITQLYHLTPKDSPGGVPHEKSGKSVGAAFVTFSILFLYFANARYFHTQQAMTRGQFPASRGAILFGSVCTAGVLLAMFVVILIDLK